MPSLRGQFLIAKPHIRDSNFFKSVVLMVEHNEEQAMGLVVNRPSSTTVAKALNGHMEATEDALVYVGGPVEPAALFILHNAAHLDPGEEAVVEDILVGSSAEVFEQVVEAAEDEDRGIRFRVYAGCSGWGPGQLEGELARGDWFLFPGSEEMVFHDDPYVVWESLVTAVQQAHRILPHPTDNPEWN